MKTTKTVGLVIAAAAAAMFASASFADTTTSTTTTTVDSVKCAGINACKTASNSCKGQGTTMVASEKDCTDKGGSVVK